MNNFNLDDLLKELSPDSPCGENVSLSPEFLQLENEAKFQPERQMGNAIVPEEAPDWKIVRDMSSALLQRSRDVRIAMHFATALINIEGILGLEKGLALIDGLLQKYWDKVYPLKDAEDPYPVMLVNTLYVFNDAKSVLNPLRNFPLAVSKVGKISWAVYESTKSKFDTISHLASQDDFTEYKKKNNDKNLPATLEEAKKITNDDFNALVQGLQEADLAALKSTATSLNNITGLLAKIGETLTEKVGSENAPDFSNLDTLTKNIHKLLADAIRSQSPQASPDTDESDTPSSELGDAQTKAKAKGYRGDGINSREDVISAIDAICNYFQANEPSSPIPFLLQRAKKLLSMNFMEILQDLTPDAVSQAEKICGVKKNE